MQAPLATHWQYLLRCAHSGEQLRLAPVVCWDGPRWGGGRCWQVRGTKWCSQGRVSTHCICNALCLHLPPLLSELTKDGNTSGSPNCWDLVLSHWATVLNELMCYATSLFLLRLTGSLVNKYASTEATAAAKGGLITIALYG